MIFICLSLTFYLPRSFCFSLRTGLARLFLLSHSTTARILPDQLAMFFTLCSFWAATMFRVCAEHPIFKTLIFLTATSMLAALSTVTATTLDFTSKSSTMLSVSSAIAGPVWGDEYCSCMEDFLPQLSLHYIVNSDWDVVVLSCTTPQVSSHCNMVYCFQLLLHNNFFNTVPSWY